MSEAYKNAGVDIEAGYEAVKRMKTHVERTKRAGVMGALGGFGGMFDLSELPYKKPVLVSGDSHSRTRIPCVPMGTRTADEILHRCCRAKEELCVGAVRCCGFLN
ncbi:hypothetical protein QEN29_25405 [Escherichia coli]|nr:hypothetical protein QEN29_25405 [Escherichia coli]